MLTLVRPVFEKWNAVTKNHIQIRRIQTRSNRETLEKYFEQIREYSRERMCAKCYYFKVWRKYALVNMKATKKMQKADY